MVNSELRIAKVTCMGMRIVEVVEYRSDWPGLFAGESALLRETLGDVSESIHHIGSTSVVGLAAKPVIDILVEVGCLGALDALDEAMVSIGYVPKGEFGIAGRRYYQKGGEERTHHVHAFQTGDSEIVRHIAFRDYLRAEPTVAEAYGRLKRAVSESCDNDMERYCEGKDAFVKEHEAIAVRLYGDGE